MKKAICTLSDIDSRDIHTQAKILVQKTEEMRLTTGTIRGELLARRVDMVLQEIESTTGVSMHEWSLNQWKTTCRTVLGLALEIMEEQDEKKHEINRLIVEQSNQRAANRRRIWDRPDQVAKRAYQKAVTMNRDAYKTKADAIRDLRIKPQFADYPDSTLRRWLTDIWDIKK
jgi:hypothetical protein